MIFLPRAGPSLGAQNVIPNFLGTWDGCGMRRYPGRYDRQDEHDYAHAHAVDEFCLVSSVSVDPRREESPNAECEIHPAQISGIGGPCKAKT
jgi:hypothetical protein